MAPVLLNKILIAPDGRSGRIVEVEAYCSAEDPAAHTYRGQPKRKATMFGEGGHMYVYFTHGMHWCANAVCGQPGKGVGVLIRALEPLEGIDRMRASRPRAKRDTDLCSGPARLAQGLSITGANDGADLVLGDRGIQDPGRWQSAAKGHSRIATHWYFQAVEHPWRWHVSGDPNVSRR
jgi:DNA-3-methyladenine glycosylase